MIATTSPARPAGAAQAPLASRTLASPVGELTLHAGPDGLRAILFPEHRHLPRLAQDEPSAIRTSSSGARTSQASSASRTAPAAEPALRALLEQAARELDEYFAGRRRAFTIALAPDGTPFQRTVWAALARIPFAETWSYGQLAAAIGRPSASRAVGAANGRNPLPIVVPCHRVIGQDGSLTGFGGGLPTKRWLLAHEAGIVAPRLPL